MSVHNRFTLIVALILVSTCTVPGAALADDPVTGGSDEMPTAISSIEQTNFTSMSGVRFSAQFDDEDLFVAVKAHNPTDRTIESALTLVIDGEQIESIEMTLSPGDTWKEEWDVVEYLDILETNHTIRTSTIEGYAEFSVTREIDPATTKEIPTPYIDEVSVENGTIDGEPSAVAKVTVVNPSTRWYPKNLMVHTTETDGSLYPASVPPGESRTITVELLDERGSRIAGEARLYNGSLEERDGAYDQVEFVGTAGEETSVWNASYEPVRPYWEDDHYQYENESLVEPQQSSVIRDYGIPAAVVGTAVALLLLVGRLRS